MKAYFVVSDVHSYYSEFIKALNEAGFDINNSEHFLVLCGDAFDRGSEAVSMFNFMKSLNDRLIYIRGNHEDLLFDCVKDLKENEGCASIHHYQNGTVDTIIQFKNANILEEVLEFIDNHTVDYFELDKYIFCHGWIPTKYNNNLDLDFKKEATTEEWQKCRWFNGMAEWHKGNKLDNRTVVCGHWHCSYGNYNYHNIGSGEFESDSSFESFVDTGIIALDSCTAFSKKVNVLKILI